MVIGLGLLDVEDGDLSGSCWVEEDYDLSAESDVQFKMKRTCLRVFVSFGGPGGRYCERGRSWGI